MDALLRLEGTELYRQLVTKEGKSHELSELVKRTVEYVSPVLDRVCVHMSQYTLHDANHSAKVVELMGQFLPGDVLDNLNVLELALLLLSGYLHDIGMASSEEEKRTIIAGNEEYKKLLYADERRRELLEAETPDPQETAKAEAEAYTEYIRRRHVSRSRAFILEKLHTDAPLKWGEVWIDSYVAAICDSHELPAEKLSDEGKWPRNCLIRNLRVNLQYLALTLRMADILDLDTERTPRGVYRFDMPENAVSLMEWKKHRSVIGCEIRPGLIEFSARCREPQAERALRRAIGWIEQERKDTLALSRKYKDELSDRYHFDFVNPVEGRQIVSDGSYIYSELHFQLDYRNVMKLLMGERLYRDPRLAVRELLQNAFDAVKCRKAVEEAQGNTGYMPDVRISIRGRLLTVEDNGMGMDMDIFSRYFMSVGNSYYASGDFPYDRKAMDVTGEFGIGILSAFMIAESMEVESRCLPRDPLHPPEPVLVEIPGAEDYFIQRKSGKTGIGTRIVLKLKKEVPVSDGGLVGLVKELAPFPAFPVTIQAGGDDVIWSGERGIFDKYIGSGVEKIEVEEVGIEGEIYLMPVEIKYEEQRGPYGTGILAQRGFKIFISGEGVYYLTPHWVCIFPVLNLTGEAALTLTPDRCGVIMDERYRDLQEKLSRIVIDYLKKRLVELGGAHGWKERKQYLDNLMGQGIFMQNGVMGEIEAPVPEVREFIEEQMLIDTIAPDGSLQVQTLKECPEGAEMLVVNERDMWHLQDLAFAAELNGWTDRKALLVLNQSEGEEQREAALDYLSYRKNGIVIFSKASLTAIRYETGNLQKENEDKIARVGEKGIHFADIIYKENDRCILMTYINTYWKWGKLYMNRRHRVFQGISLDKAGCDETLWLQLNNFIEQVDTVIQNTVDDIRSNTDDFEWYKMQNEYRNMNYTMIDIFHKRPELLDKLNEETACFLKGMKKSGYLGKNKRTPVLTKDDFPWFWSREAPKQDV